MANRTHASDPEVAQRRPPLLFHRGTGRRPWLMLGIVIANTVMLVVAMYVNNCPAHWDDCTARFLGRFSFQPWKQNIMLGPDTDTLRKLGALVGEKVFEHQEQWRLLTAQWLHHGVLHLLANMFALLFIGIPLEKEYGFVKIGLLYLISGVAANVVSALFIEPYVVSAGASGAVFGLIGGMLAELIINWSIYTHKVYALVTMVTGVVVELVGDGLIAYVNNYAHIGGFISGFLLGCILLVRPQFGWTSQRYAPPERVPTENKQKFKVYQYVLQILSLVLLTVGFTVGLILALRGYDGNKHCSWCHYLRCIPINKSRCKGYASCQYETIEDEITVTCSTNMSRTYTLLLSDASQSNLQKLCYALCRY